MNSTATASVDPLPSLDTALSFETPEGGEIELHPAGFFARGVALLIDELLRQAIIIMAAIVMALLGELGLGIYLLIWFVVYWFYSVVFEVFFGGATPGKRSMALTVVHDDGTPVRLPASLIRNLLLVADFLPLPLGWRHHLHDVEPALRPNG